MKFTEEQKLQIRARMSPLADNKKEICIEYIESIISPIPHQDGASAEDVVKATIMGYVDPNQVAKISGELMRVFQSETAKVVAEKDREQTGYITVSEMRKLFAHRASRILDDLNVGANQLMTFTDFKVALADMRWRIGDKSNEQLQSELSAANERIKELNGIN